ncbi:MAG: DUF262 domain-containing protein [Candidatus Thiothrix putei]|uniref:DUF262 domain-containing protein n=1 Tax=Candidatus Thiothrix putei TaxID=3080811 RepID=A0AA95KKG1_9GAMM|nr:MAG: DUF262 domain-containing protein [Candidatus Thiothrix putei]
MSEQIANDKLVPVKDLLNKKFLIPSYQRGYRWTCRQVNDLLDDILEFSKNNVDSYYCLQPLIVKEIENGEYQGFWEVIDGQQRLTTIHIIFSYLSFKEKLPVCIDLENFEIRYETREQQGHSSAVFLKEINEKSKPEAENNVDFLHMFYAYNTIEKWCGIYEINVGDLLNNVKFIWYDVNKEEDSHEVFARFNMGKIQLTNAELIKALFLQQKNFGDHAETIRRKQLEIAMEWDTIELSLQDDDFWYFLNKKKCETPTRIEFIFDLISKKQEKSDKDHSFRYFYGKLKAKNGIQLSKDLHEEWMKVKNYHLVFREWFEDDELYQMVGFLIAAKKCEISDLKIEYETKSKVDFKTDLKEKIKNTLELSKPKSDFIDGLSYDKNKELIKNILLWFNIKHTSLQYENNKIYRFPFGYYNRENISWSLEHIHAQNSEELKTKKEWERWFKDHHGVLKELQEKTNLQSEVDKKEVDKIIHELSNFYDDENEKLNGISELKDEQEISRDIIDQYSKIKDMVFSLFDKCFHHNLHGIGNLALLDSRSNTKLSNSIFIVKRQNIIDIDKAGSRIFVPPCTRYVFMKYFTKYPSQFYYWGKNDADDYIKAIKVTLEASLLADEGKNK